ncbi:MAG: restriction endonuclease subunit S, partial [Ignavibacteria bacterium]|nr:restriction endonuclease subunit S [Ignavibacteria bacterium]
NGITDRINQWKVKAPGVVTGRSGTIGNVHFIEEDFWPLNTALYIRDFHENDERFIYYLLTAFDLSKYSSGAGVPTLNRNNVHSIKVSIPKSKEAQQTIVRQLDALRAETQKLEAVYQKKIDDLEELKKSILQKAFAGELKMSEPLINAD